jgi:type III restriction enzyme
MLDAEIHHTIELDGSGPADYRSVVGFFARQLLQDLRLVGGYDVLYGKVKSFMADYLFDSSPVSLENPVVLRNFSEPDAGKVLYDSFKVDLSTGLVASRSR